ncbi:MAG: hypothetical protein ACRC4M_02640 [Mycoplasma sp.]
MKIIKKEYWSLKEKQLINSNTEKELINVLEKQNVLFNNRDLTLIFKSENKEQIIMIDKMIRTLYKEIFGERETDGVMVSMKVESSSPEKIIKKVGTLIDNGSLLIFSNESDGIKIIAPIEEEEKILKTFETKERNKNFSLG